jgi:regulatory protein
LKQDVDLNAVHVITLIETQKKDKDRVNIYLDGSFAFGLKKEVLLKHALKKGVTVTEKLIQDVLLAEEHLRAKDKAFALLSYRAHSVQEMTQKLRKRGFSLWSIDVTLKDLIRVGVLDDEKFAVEFAQYRLRNRPMGKRLLQQELQAKGVNETLSIQAVENAYTDQTELEVARNLSKKKTLRWVKMDKKNKKRLVDFLLRRGFNWHEINTVIGEYSWETET